MVFISKSSLYAILASSYLATGKNESFVPISLIAKDLDISFHYLAKIIRQLKQSGIVKSNRGANGGVILARSSDSITIFEIIKAIEGDKIKFDFSKSINEYIDSNDNNLTLELKQLFNKFLNSLNQSTLKNFIEYAKNDFIF